MIIEIDREIADNLSETEMGIVRYINQHSDKLSTMSIVDIADHTFSSPATVSRAIRKCHLQGFNELRYLAAKDNDSKNVKVASEIMEKSLIEAQNVISHLSIENVLKTIEILRTSSRIYVLARGLTGYVAEEFAFKLQLLGFNAFCIKDRNIMRIKASEIEKDEMMFIFSLNGKTPELVESAAMARKNGARVINCCCSESSRMNEYADVSLIGYKHSHQAITKYEVSSRVSLSMIARIIIDYLTE